MKAFCDTYKSRYIHEIDCQLLLLFTLCVVLSSCGEEDALTGNAQLTFTGNTQGLEISIYPESVYTISDLLATQPLIRDINATGGFASIEGLNPGNYTWYDDRDNIGFFQITAGQTRSFSFSIR